MAASSKTRTTILGIVKWVLSWIGAAITGILGFAPPDVVASLLGKAQVNELTRFVMSVDQGVIRWALVAMSYGLFAGGIFYLIGIPMVSIRRSQGELRKKLDEDNEAIKEVREMLREIRKKERGIKIIHNRTYKMLAEIRKRKGAAESIHRSEPNGKLR